MANLIKVNEKKQPYQLSILLITVCLLSVLIRVAMILLTLYFSTTFLPLP